MRKKNRALRSCTAVLAAAILAFSGAVPYEGILQTLRSDVSFADTAEAAEASASSIRLEQTEGTVTAKDSAGKDLVQAAGMRLYSGSTLSTAAKSYAWMSLDDTKAAKLDEASNINITKSGKKLDILLNEGAIFFDVSEKLAADESFTIRTSTMVMGIRGTIGWVRKLSATKTEVGILEGSVEVTVKDPATGKPITKTITAGSMAELDSAAATKQTDRIIIRKIQKSDIDGFILVDIAKGNAADGARRRFNVKGGGGVTSGRIFFACGIDLRGLLETSAKKQLREDQAQLASEGEFDPVYYTNRYADVHKAHGTDPAKMWNHYRDFGQFEGRFANAKQEARKKKVPVEEEGTPTTEGDPVDWDVILRALNNNPEPASSSSITINASAGGTASADKTSAAAGDTVTLTATATTGYAFQNWRVVSGSVSLADAASPTTTFVMGTEAVQIEAVFAARAAAQYTVTVTAGTGGSAAADKSTAITGETVTLAATATTGYVFQNWHVAGGGVSLADALSPTTTFVMGTEDVQIEAVFAAAAAPKYTVSVTAGTGGTATVTPAQAVQGTTITLAATPLTGYVFDKWTVVSGGVTLSSAATATATFVMPDNDVSVQANFKAIPKYTVTVTAGTGGTASATPTTAESGTAITLTASAATDYVFDKWTVVSGGVTLSSDTAATATFTLPDNDVTVRADFKALHSVVASVDAGQFANTPGTAASSRDRAAKGEDITVTASPNAGYRFKEWTVVSGGVTLSSSTSASATFTMPDQDVEVRATFERVYTITFNINDQGWTGVTHSVKVNGTETLQAAENDTVVLNVNCANAQPPTAFIGDIRVSDATSTLYYFYQYMYGDPLEFDLTYTFTMPGEDVTIDVIMNTTP